MSCGLLVLWLPVAEGEGVTSVGRLTSDGGAGGDICRWVASCADRSVVGVSLLS